MAASSMKCIYCQHFTMKAYPKHAAVGLGHCPPMSKESGITVFVPWNGEPECSKREPAKDKAAREAWVLKREGK